MSSMNSTETFRSRLVGDIFFFNLPQTLFFLQVACEVAMWQKAIKVS